jgi:hypothetical protein
MRGRETIWACLSVVAIVCACGGPSAKTPAGARASCSADSECVVTTESSCCQSCPDAPRAIPTLAFEQMKNRCAEKDCAARSDRIECAKVEASTGWVPRCKDGTCAALKP